MTDYHDAAPPETPAISVVAKDAIPYQIVLGERFGWISGACPDETDDFPGDDDNDSETYGPRAMRKDD